MSAQNGIIVLTGLVRSREEWMRALRIARDHGGVSAVQTDELAIDDR